jgi:hypothetical protein
MLKNFHQVEIEIFGKAMKFMCEMGSEFNHIKEGLFQFQKFFGNMEDQTRAQMEAQAQIAPIAETNNQEPKSVG